MNPTDPLRIQIHRWQRMSLVVGAVAMLLAIVGYFLDPVQFLRSYLFGYLYWLGMGLGCLAILLLHHTVGGKWGMLIRRMCEAGARTLPYMFVLLLPILVNLPLLYPWARPEAAHDPLIYLKAAYLNIPAVIGRAIFYFVIWALYAYLLSRWSGEQDRTGDEKLIGKMRSWSAPGLIVFTFVTTFAFVDWVMSLEPHWFSTVYGAMFLVGQVLESFAFLIALVIILAGRPPLREHVTKQHLHDLGNLMFAFMVLWAYLSFSQFLIIWSGNLPEETPWYLHRLNGGWTWVALSLVIFHFSVPFLLLLLRGVKRDAERLLKVCVLMIAVRVIDVYWVIEPAFYNRTLNLHWLDAVTLIAVGGLWLAGFCWQLQLRPILPLRDSRLEGSPRETVAF
ncbi:hypothetical protein [Bryobacter aggregatus]|uniref:hypothetical protein n=1 Tax=Bryobacter aggregatus TaxID=360054 RepID=UPI0004E176E5|nr:hypothetical protein [Bryobacter aggregatus]